MYTGANIDDTHLRGVDVERDIAVGRWADLREATAGEACVNCGHPLEVERGIEVGHIFKLGYKFTDTIGISVSGPDGKPVRPIMGSYGIGVERAMATAIEVHHDDKGIIWPTAIAPFEVDVVIAQQDDPAVAAAGEQVYQALLAAGVEVIVDDRPVRAGVKFSDAELVGIPFRVTVGKRGLVGGSAELTDRAAGSTVRSRWTSCPSTSGRPWPRPGRATRRTWHLTLHPHLVNSPPSRRSPRPGFTRPGGRGPGSAAPAARRRGPRGAGGAARRADPRP